MAKLRFDFTPPVERRVIGVDLLPVITLNTEHMVCTGHYQEWIQDVATGEETLDPKPIVFEVQLDETAFQTILGSIVALAHDQGSLEPAELTVLPNEGPVAPPTPAPVAPRIRALPALATVAPSGTVQFTTEILDSELTAVGWEALDGGSVDANGLFTAPAEPGEYRIVVALTTTAAASVAVVTVS